MPVDTTRLNGLEVQLLEDGYCAPPWRDDARPKFQVVVKSREKQATFDFWGSNAGGETTAERAIAAVLQDAETYYANRGADSEPADDVLDLEGVGLDADDLAGIREISDAYGYEDPTEAIRVWLGCKRNAEKLQRVGIDSLENVTELREQAERQM